MIRGFLSVEVIGLREYRSKGGQNTKSTGLQKLGHTFVKAFVKDFVEKTSTKEPSTAPNWDEELIFDVEVDKTEKVYLRLYEETPENENLLAEMFVTFGDIWSGKFNQRFSRSMTIISGNIFPKIMLSINWEAYDPTNEESRSKNSIYMRKMLSDKKFLEAQKNNQPASDDESGESAKNSKTRNKTSDLCSTESDDDNYKSSRSEEGSNFDLLANRPEIVECIKPSDFIDYSLMKLSGPRPGLLRAEPYYSTAKMIYGNVTGLPIINFFGGIAENVVEGILCFTPLKPKNNSPEQNDEKLCTRAVDGLDKIIEGALCGIDNFFDAKKDDTLKTICDVKDFIKGTTHFAVSGTFGFIGGLFSHGENETKMSLISPASSED